MRRLAGKLRKLQLGHVLSFQGMREVVRQFCSPCNAAFFQDDIVCMANAEARGVVRFDIRKGRCRPVVEHSATVRSPSVECDGDVFQTDIANAALGRAAQCARCSRPGR